MSPPAPFLQQSLALVCLAFSCYFRLYSSWNITSQYEHNSHLTTRCSATLSPPASRARALTNCLHTRLGQSFRSSPCLDLLHQVKRVRRRAKALPFKPFRPLHTPHYSPIRSSMASSLASSSSSSNSVLSARILYRSLLRELRSNPNNVPPPDSRRITSSLQFRSQPIVSLVREAFRADAEGSAALSEMRNLELYLRSNRTHKVSISGCA